MIFTKPSLSAHLWIFSSSLTAVPRMSSPLFASPARSIFWSKWRSIRSSDRWIFCALWVGVGVVSLEVWLADWAFAGCNVCVSKILVLNTKLGGGFTYFSFYYFHLENWGRWIQFDEHIFFQMGWKLETTNMVKIQPCNKAGGFQRRVFSLDPIS